MWADQQWFKHLNDWSEIINFDKNLWGLNIRNKIVPKIIYSTFGPWWRLHSESYSLTIIGRLDKWRGS